jgi:hypothetical protein
MGMSKIEFKKGILKSAKEEKLTEYIKQNYLKGIRNFNSAIIELSEEFETRYFLEIYNEILQETEERLDSEDFDEFEYGFSEISEEEILFYTEMTRGIRHPEQYEMVLDSMKKSLYIPNQDIYNILGEEWFDIYKNKLKEI